MLSEVWSVWGLWNLCLKMGKRIRPPNGPCALVMSYGRLISHRREETMTILTITQLSDGRLHLRSATSTISAAAQHR